MYDLMRQGRYDLMPALLSSREAADAVGVTPQDHREDVRGGKARGRPFR